MTVNIEARGFRACLLAALDPVAVSLTLVQVELDIVDYT